MGISRRLAAVCGVLRRPAASCGFQADPDIPARCRALFPVALTSEFPAYSRD